MIVRHISSELDASLNLFPAVMIVGPRQSGKTTLAKTLLDNGKVKDFVSLDSTSQLSLAKNDPEGYIERLDKPVVIDEIQRVPELLLAVKADIDNNRQAGKFVLTGSVDLLLTPKMLDSLAGRMRPLTLWPFSQSEVRGSSRNFVEQVTAAKFVVEAPEGSVDLVETMLTGSYPELLEITDIADRSRWFEAYLDLVLQRDVADISRLELSAMLPRLVRILATRAAQPLNKAGMANELGMNHSTLQRHLTVLENVFLVNTLPAWHSNIGLRITKSAKLLFSDSGLMAHTNGITKEKVAADLNLLGQITENFVGMELVKLASILPTPPRLHYLRTYSGAEVDYVFETHSARIVGVEVKASKSLSPQDMKGLRLLADKTGERFLRGVILYRGARIEHLAKDIYAVPISCLWA